MIALGIENATKYVITAADGTRLVFNDRSDPDFVGYLDADSGTTGLDGSEQRSSSTDIVEGDGAITGDAFLSARAFTFSGMIDPIGGISNVNSRITKLRRVVNGALRSDLTVTWQTTGGVPVEIVGRRAAPLRISARSPKLFLISLVAGDPRVYSQATKLATASADTSAGGGFTSPLRSPLTSDALIAGQIVAANDGSFDTWPILTIYGPGTNPTIRNVTTGQEIRLIYTIGAAEFLRLYAVDGTIRLNDESDRDSALDFSNSDFFPLVPGNNDIRLLFSSYSTGASFAVEWRDAWE